MPDFYASPAGNDSNSGTSGSPFRTLTRATAAATSAGGVGTIHAANGRYDPGAGESFPISIPPGYVLEGESRDGTEVQSASPDSTVGIAAIESGSGVRNLTLRAGVPAAGGSNVTCNRGLAVNTNDAVIENVRITPSRDVAPPIPWNNLPSDLGIFFWALHTEGALRTRIRNVHQSWSHGWVGGRATVEDCTIDDHILLLDSGTVLRSSFLGSEGATGLYCAVNDEIEVAGCRFVNSATFRTDTLNLLLRTGTAGPTVRNNRFERSGIGVPGDFSTGRFSGNTTIESIRLSVNGSPHFRGDTFISDGSNPHWRWINVGGDFGPGPVFENCVFRHPRGASDRSDYFALYRGADLGGGGRSIGGNDFREVDLILCNAPGQEIYLQNNQWRDPADPGAQLQIISGTTVRL